MSASTKQKLTSIGKVLLDLNKQPLPHFKPEVKTLKLDLAPRNGHWGARHFLKEDLPRIAYANPGVKYQVSKFRQLTLENPWKPTLQLEFANGKKYSIEIHEKRSEDIMKELMRIAGVSKPERTA
ncbi:hypothetical protein CTheo_3552 [Ceratobasidium theobromae]|uniref:Ribosomal protein/NADH dehydrogenase domain-containing protein n=1 Tax=Ceratobasidium theobromae TaxID=1582974 RepID=A0A5N5QN43_9AGAM|nr:hypothetical protein CTheo_3552 [Ceratobasidium theobromae]